MPAYAARNKFCRVSNMLCFGLGFNCEVVLSVAHRVYLANQLRLLMT